MTWSQNSRMSFSASHLPPPTLEKKLLCSADCAPNGVFFCLRRCLRWPRLPGSQLLHTLLHGHLAGARSRCTQIFSGSLWPREPSRDRGGRRTHRRSATEAGAPLLPSPDGSWRPLGERDLEQKPKDIKSSPGSAATQL